MPFNIDSFKANIDEYGYLQNNKYEARVYTPPFLAGGINGGGDRMASIMRFRIDTVRAPGIQILSADNNRYGVGPTQKQPINAQFNEISISFIVDENGEIWQFWYDWVRGIYEFTSDNVTNRQGRYSSRYKNEYASFMQILVFDNYGNTAKTFNIYEVFPTSINETSLSWNDTNQVLKLGVTLSYKEFNIE
jgi:hypothetical protein